MKPPRSKPCAFTLLEVIVSLAIFAIAAIALSAAYINVLNGYQNRDRERAIDEAWALVRIAALRESDADKLEAGDTLTLPDNRRVTWHARIEPTTVANLFAVELSAESPAPDEWIRHARIMLLRPEWGDPAERDQLREANRQRMERNRAR